MDLKHNNTRLTFNISQFFSKEFLIKAAKLLCFLLSTSLLLSLGIFIFALMPTDFSLLAIQLTDWQIVLLNTWPILAIITIFYFLFNRLWISFSVTGLLAFIITLVNRFKMSFRDEPFVFEDVFLITEASDMAEKYNLFFEPIALYAFLFIVAITVLSFFMSKTKIRNLYIRAAGAFCMSVLLVISCNLFYFDNEKMYDATWHAEFGNPWKAGDRTRSAGIVYSFIKSMPDAFMTAPEDYDEETAQKLLESHQTVPLPSDKKVHIISIMLEAYNDFSRFDGIQLSADPYKNFHDLQKDSYSGRLYTNIFAGGTIKTERAFLTGYNDTDFLKKDIPSYVRYFKEQGYYAEAMHPCYGWFYDRISINQYLGFDNFDYYENAYFDVDEESLAVEPYQGLLSDYDFFDYIIKGYKQALAKDQMYFNFSVTYQNHGPYVAETPIKKQYLYKKDEYNPQDYEIFNTYLHGIYKTDLALLKIRKYIDRQSEPIVLILFGDHNPWLGDNNSVYKMLGIDLDFATVEGAANYYQTPYLFYANAAAKATLKKDFVGNGNTISPMFLMNELFEYADLKGPAYLNYLQTVKEQYNVINPIYVGNEGSYTLYKEFHYQEKLKQQSWVEFYMKTNN